MSVANPITNDDMLYGPYNIDLERLSCTITSVIVDVLDSVSHMHRVASINIRIGLGSFSIIEYDRFTMETRPRIDTVCNTRERCGHGIEMSTSIKKHIDSIDECTRVIRNKIIHESIRLILSREPKLAHVLVECSMLASHPYIPTIYDMGLTERLLNAFIFTRAFEILKRNDKSFTFSPIN